MSRTPETVHGPAGEAKEGAEPTGSGAHDVAPPEPLTERLGRHPWSHRSSAEVKEARNG